MKKKLMSALAACGVLAVPAFAPAQQAPHDATTHAATMLCRPATEKEHPTAMLMDGKTPIVCKPMNAAMMMMNGKGGPDISKAQTPAEVDAAWRAYITSMITVAGDAGG